MARRMARKPPLLPPLEHAAKPTRLSSLIEVMEQDGFVEMLRQSKYKKKERNSRVSRHSNVSTTSSFSGSKKAADKELKLPSIGKAKMEMGSLVSPAVLTTLKKVREKASKKAFEKWLENKTETEDDELDEDEAQFHERLQRRRQRRASMVAFANWCADKDNQRLEDLDRIRTRQQQQWEEVEDDKEYLESMARNLRSEINQDLQKELEGLNALGGQDTFSHNPKLRRFSERAQREIFVGVKELEAALDMVSPSATNQRPMAR